MSNKKTQRIDIKFDGLDNKGHGKMTFEGKTYDVVGKPGYQYPKDLTINASDKDHNYHSREFDVKLPYAVKLDGTEGIYLHEDVTSGMGDNSHGETHGCINLKKDDAKEVYDKINTRTRVTISSPWDDKK